MLTMVNTTMSYAVVYNLYFHRLCSFLSACRRVLCFRHVSNSDGCMVPLGVRGEIQAASLSCVRQKGL